MNLAVVGAQLPDLREQLEVAPPADAAVVSIGTNHIAKPGGPLDFAELPEIAVDLRALYARVAVLPVLVREGAGGPYCEEFAERKARFLAALAATGLAPLPFRLRRWHWQRDDMHPNSWGQRHIARHVTRWLADA